MRGNEYHVKREEKDIDLIPRGCSWPKIFSQNNKNVKKKSKGEGMNTM